MKIIKFWIIILKKYNFHKQINKIFNLHNKDILIQNNKKWSLKKIYYKNQNFKIISNFLYFRKQFFNFFSLTQKTDLIKLFIKNNSKIK